MPIYVVSIDSALEDAENQTKEAQLAEPQTTIGRNFLCFKCEDRRVSRTHGILVRGENENTVTIKSMNDNPIYIKIGDGSEIEMLTKERAPTELRHNDEFGLLREKFWYKINVRDEAEHTNGVPMLRIRPPTELNCSQNLPQILADVVNGVNEPPNNCDNLNQEAAAIEPDEPLSALAVENQPVQAESSEATQPPPTQPPLPGSKRTITMTQACSQTIDSTTDGSPPKRIKTEPESGSQNDHGEATPAPQEDNNVPESAAGQSSTSINDPSNVTVKTEVKKEAADSSALRDSCEFGIRCYRRNIEHRTQFAHPGDRDYRRPNYPPAPIGAPPCPFGASCYRRNPQHFIDFSHPDSSSYTPQSSQPPPPPISNRASSMTPPPGILFPMGNFNHSTSSDEPDTTDEEEEEAEEEENEDFDFSADSDDDFNPESEASSDDDIDDGVDDNASEDGAEGQPNEE